MNQIVNKLLSAGDKLMPEMHLRQPGFTYDASEPFTKNKKRKEKFKETVNLRYIYQGKLTKACFQHDMTYGDSTRKADSDKILCDKAFNIAKNPKHGRYQRGLALMFYKFFDKKTAGSAIKDEKYGKPRIS